MITLIVAMDPHNGIGKNGKLPWHIKEDLKLFKERTLHHKVVMGRKTYESIGRALPNRENFIVSRTVDSIDENIQIIRDFDAFLEEKKDTSENIYIIGGSEIYTKALPYAKRLAISFVKKTYDCDTFFPMFNINRYKVIESQEFDEFKFTLLEKI
jgi:dihydrofolate reductase